MAVFVARDRGAAVARRRLPFKRHRAVARFRLQVPRRRRGKTGRRLDPRGRPCSPGVHRPHLEAVERSVGQIPERARRAGPRRNPRRALGNRGSFGAARLVAPDRGAVAVRRRRPAQDDAAVFRRRNNVLGDGRCTRRRLNPRGRPRSPGVHRPHLEAVERPVGQLPERARRAGPRRNPGRALGNRGARGAARLVAGDIGAAVARRRRPSQDDAAVFRRRHQVPRRGRRAVVVLDRDRHDAIVLAAGGPPVRFAEEQPRGLKDRTSDLHLEFLVVLVEGVVDDGERNRFARLPDAAGSGEVLRIDVNHDCQRFDVRGERCAAGNTRRGHRHTECIERTVAARLPLRDDHNTGFARAFGEAVGRLLRSHGDRGMLHRRRRHRGGIARAARVHRPDLEGIGPAVGQVVDGYKSVRTVGAQRIPGRLRRHRGALGVAQFVVGNRGTAPVSRRIPLQRHLPVAGRRLQVPRRGRGKAGRRLDLRRGSASVLVHRADLERVERPVGQLPQRARRAGPGRNPGRALGNRGARGAAHLVAGDNGAATVRRRRPFQDDAAVFRRRDDIPRRGGYGSFGSRLYLCRPPGALGVLRADLEGVERAVGQLSKRARSLAGSPPGRIPGNRCAFGSAERVVHDIEAAIVRRRRPPQDNLAVARGRRQAPRHGGGFIGSRLDLHGRPGALCVHRPHLEAVLRPVGQLTESERREGPVASPLSTLGHGGAFGAAHFVAQDSGAAVALRRRPSQDDAAVFRRRDDILWSGRYGQSLRLCADDGQEGNDEGEQSANEPEVRDRGTRRFGGLDAAFVPDRVRRSDTCIHE